MSYLERLRTGAKILERAACPSVESVETTPGGGLDTLDTTPSGPSQNFEGQEADTEIQDADPRPSPWPALYRQWFAGITEPRALVTLDDDQVQAAVTAGLIAADLARESVLVAYRAPLGAQGSRAASPLGGAKHSVRGRRGDRQRQPIGRADAAHG